MNNYPDNPDYPDHRQFNNPRHNNPEGTQNIPVQNNNNDYNPNISNRPGPDSPPNKDNPVPGTPGNGNPNNPPDQNPQQDNPQKKENLEPTSLKALKQLGQNNPATNVESDIHTIPIIGQIEGHLVLPPKNKTTKYEHIIPQLVAVEENPKVNGLLLLLNTVGGDIEAGLAIAEMISSMSKPTVSIVLGGGHSIGIPVAVATDFSLIVATASMTIHPIRLSGKIIGVPQTYEYLDKMQDRIISFVTKHSAINEENFRELMFQTGELVRDVGTVLIGKEAVEAEIIQEVGGLAKALGKLRFVIDSEGDKQ